MSHFSVLVLTSNGTPEEAEALLAPFDENLEVPAYERKCWCIGTLAKGRAHSLTEQQMPIAPARLAFQERPEIKKLVEASKAAGNYGFSPEVDLQWKNEFETPFLKLFEQNLQADHGATDPNPACDNCGGTGSITTTENPSGRWDRYTLGGVWAEKYNLMQGVTAEEFLKQPLRMFSIVTPDGRWLEKGEIILYSVFENEDWEGTFARTLAEFSQHRVLIYDCYV